MRNDLDLVQMNSFGCGLDAIAVGPTLKDVHTPDESMELASSERFYTLLVDVLKRLAA